VDALQLLQPGAGRQARPKRLAVLLRGLPGSGKSHVARLLREREVAAGGEAPRILSLDDYFMTVSCCLYCQFCCLLCVCCTVHLPALPALHRAVAAASRLLVPHGVAATRAVILNSSGSWVPKADVCFMPADHQLPSPAHTAAAMA
jgi:hypothetical protein